MGTRSFADSRPKTYERTVTIPAKFISSLKEKVGKIKYSVDSPPGTIESRVFIAGSYKIMPVLREIEGYVRELGYQPIIPYDFEMDKANSADYSFRLLSMCRYAIFELTISAGNIVEYSFVKSSMISIRTLPVFMSINPKKEKPDEISTMVWNLDPPPEGYCNFDELNELVTEFLGFYMETTT